MNAVTSLLDARCLGLVRIDALLAVIGKDGIHAVHTWQDFQIGNVVPRHVPYVSAWDLNMKEWRLLWDH